MNKFLTIAFFVIAPVVMLCLPPAWAGLLGTVYSVVVIAKTGCV